MTDGRDGRELGEPLTAHRIDEAALSNYLSSHIAGFDGVLGIQQFLGGQSNPTYLIESGSGAYVLRKKPPGVLLPSAHAVDREYRVLSALQGSAVPVPRMHVLCEDEDVIGQMFYVMDYVPGRVISENSMPQCSAADRSGMYFSMAEVFGTLHAVDYQAVGLEDFGKPSSYVARQVARWSMQYEASKVEDFAAMDKIIDWLPANNPDDDQSSIVHGDYRAGNMIFDNEKPIVASVLDWELSTIGHPLADLGYFLMPFRLEADSLTGGIKGLDLEGLGIPSEKELVESYARSAGHEKIPNIDFYVVFAMFRLAAILAGVLRRGLDGNAADPRAIERGNAFKQLAESAWTIAEAIE